MLDVPTDDAVSSRYILDFAIPLSLVGLCFLSGFFFRSGIHCRSTNGVFYLSNKQSDICTNFNKLLKEIAICVYLNVGTCKLP